jgi:hypothetical protein
MRKLIFSLVSCAALSATAQTESDIHNHYQDVNKRIESSIAHGMEGELYCNEWVSNKYSKSWPAVGIYNETTDFWYDDDPNHLSPQDRDPKITLLKVAITRRSAELTTTEEYLYKNGHLVFYYSKEGEEGQERQTRIWFNAKGMFKTSVKSDGKELSPKELATKEYSDFKPRTAVVLKDGKHYQDLFLKNMLY